MADAHAHERLLEPRERPPGSSAPRPLSAILTPWFAFLGGAAAWVLHLTVAYVIAEIGCQSQRLDVRLLGIPGPDFFGFALTLLAGATAVGAAVTAFRLYPGEATGDPVDEPGARESIGRDRFMAYAGLIMNGIFLVAILAGGLPFMFLQSCTS